MNLGPYLVERELGRGGMGVVYLARDRKLNRQVAIKVLPHALSHDPDHLARFRREATLLASLNHPNIATIYGVEESEGQQLLVLEYVGGQTLAELGGLPIKEAVAVARQLVDALEAAHEAGVVHRDLKPANIKVRDDGTVKVLDFGLAKAMEKSEGQEPHAKEDPTPPTMTSPAMTAMGVILGTPAYMAPEQAKGRAVDRRADIWAFGCVLFEMLTSQRPFKGDDLADTMVSVLRDEPDWSRLPADAPASLRRLLRRCLEKDARRRLSAIGDARFDLEDAAGPALAPMISAEQARPASRRWVLMLLSAAAGVIVTAVAAALFLSSSRRAPSSGLTRVSILPPTDVSLFPDTGENSISPDGRYIAFVTGTSQSRESSRLWIRSLESLSAREVPGAEGGHYPFWSPDSSRLGFFAGGQLKTTVVSGGRPAVICRAANGRGGTWSTQGTIVFAPETSGPLHRVSANGGESQPVTTLDASRSETGHRVPFFLPDGEHFLFVALPARAGKFEVFVASLGSGTPELLGSFESSPIYADPGWLLFMREGVLAAQPFDARTRKLTGEAVTLDDGPSGVLDSAGAMTAAHAATASATGALAYLTDPNVELLPTWLDASGRPTGSAGIPAGRYSSVALAPNGRYAALVRTASPTESTIWLADLDRSGSLAPLVKGQGLNYSPVWSPDSTRISFSSDREGPENLFIKDVGKPTPERLLFASSGTLFKVPEQWSPDGRLILFRQIEQATSQNIFSVPVDGKQSASLIVKGPGRDQNAAVSPDGRFLAYLSEDTGRLEVYVQPFGTAGPRVQATTTGASEVWWRRDSRELLILDGVRTQLLAAEVGPGMPLHVSPARVIGRIPDETTGIDAAADLKRLIALVPAHPKVSRTITVVMDWASALK